MKNDIPIYIIGAGPAGVSAAWTLAKSGFNRVTIFEKRCWPRQKVCAGGLGPNALSWLKKAGMLHCLSRKAVVVDSLRFTGPSGKTALLTRSNKMAWVIPRILFDQFMLEQALKVGALFQPETKVLSLTQQRGRVEVCSSAGDVEAAAVIVTTGAQWTAHGLMLPPTTSVNSIIARYNNFSHNPNQIEMIFSKELAPHYAWLFPEPEGHVNIGLFAGKGIKDESLHSALDKVLERYFFERIGNAKQVGLRKGALIRYSDKVGRVVSGRILLAGETAGLVNSATGEGIPYALESGALAAKSLVEAVSRNIVDDVKLARYQDFIKRRFSHRLKIAATFRHFVKSPLFEVAADMATVRIIRRFLARFLSGI